MMKTVITLRTRNAWVHAIAYHAIPPHVVVDTPLVVKVFGLRCAATRVSSESASYRGAVW
jgi:hypothetical protein